MADAPVATPVAEAPIAQPAPVADTPVADEPVADAPMADAPEANATPEADAVTEAEATPEPEAAPAQAEAAQHQDEDENDIVPGQPDAEVEAFFADSPTAELENDMLDEDEAATTPLTLVASNDAPAADIAEDVTPAAPAAGPDSIAAKLERIRAVVARQSDADDDDDYL